MKISSAVLIISPLLISSFISLFVHIKLGHLDSQVKYNIVSTNIVYAVIFLATFEGLSRLRILPQKLVEIVLSLGLVLFFALTLLYRGILLTDIATLTTPLIFIFCYQLLPRNNLNFATYRKILKILLICTFIKYIVSKYIFEINRPGVFTENNFEIMFLILISLPSLLCRHRFVWFVLGGIVVVSGSLSAQISFMGVFMYCIVFNVFKLARISQISLMIFSVIIAALALGQKYSNLSLEEIDRGIMLIAFFHDFGQRAIFEMLLNFPGEFVSDTTSLTLNSYEKLFSSTDPSRAFSVIFHSALLRFTYDFGILGLILFIVVLTYFMRSQRIYFRIIHCILIVMVLNGLSVSSFYNVFFWMGLMMLNFLSYRSLMEELKGSKSSNLGREYSRN